ncbi:MAG: type II toxin-antitoxin system RelE/ParE family toxin [bacterium]
MPEIIITEEFQKRYMGLPLSIQKKAEKQEKIFQLNPFHPSLHTEKLEPRSRQVWSIRIDRKYRIIFRFVDGNQALFLTVGEHNWVYKLNIC